MTVKAMEKKGLGRAEINTIKKLKTIWKKSENGTAIGVENLRGKLAEILGEIRASAEQETNFETAEDNFQNHMHNAELIKELELEIPTDDAPLAQITRDKILGNCGEIIRNITGNDPINLDTSTLTSDALVQQGYDSD